MLVKSVKGVKIDRWIYTYRVALNIRLPRYTAFSLVCKRVTIFLESFEREDRGGKGGEEEKNIAKQSYHVLNP